jgi:hypothetical protein
MKGKKACTYLLDPYMMKGNHAMEAQDIPITCKFYVQKYAGKTTASSETLRNHIIQGLKTTMHSTLKL